MGDRKAPGGKEDLKKFKEEIVHQFHVISEDVISEVKQVAEGVANVDEKLDRARQELKAEIDNKIQPVAQAVGGLSEQLDKTRQELRSEIQGIRQELKAEIQETRQEVWQPSNSRMLNWINVLQPSKRNFSNSNTVSKK